MHRHCISNICLPGGLHDRMSRRTSSPLATICNDKAASCNGNLQGANTDARWRDKCKVRAPMQDGGANTNANSNGPKRQRLTCNENSVLCALFLLCCFCCEWCCFGFFVHCFFFSDTVQVKSCVTHYGFASPNITRLGVISHMS